jgi:predicted small lipoprotein YifL
MKTPAWICLALLAAAACGSSGPSSLPQADACNQASKAACAKIYGCQATLATALFGTEDACVTSIVTSCGTTGFQCGATQTYHGDKAEMCKDQFTAMSCDTLLQTVFPSLGSNVSLGGAFAAITTSIPVCGEICTTP